MGKFREGNKQSIKIMLGISFSELLVILVVSVVVVKPNDMPVILRRVHHFARWAKNYVILMQNTAKEIKTELSTIWDEASEAEQEIYDTSIIKELEDLRKSKQKTAIQAAPQKTATTTTTTIETNKKTNTDRATTNNPTKWKNQK